MGLPLAFALFRVGYDWVIFRISGPGSLSLGLRDLSAYSVGSSIGSRSFKGSRLAGRRVGFTSTELLETWGHLSWGPLSFRLTCTKQKRFMKYTPWLEPAVPIWWYLH